MRRSVVSLLVANSISLFAVGFSYLLYSRLLSPAEFGLYSAALVIASFGTVILDGGLKNTIIKSPDDLTRDQQSTLLFLMCSSSLVLVVLLAAANRPLEHFYPAAQHDYRFLALFAAVFLLTYPFTSIPTAFLERRFAYQRIAIIESVGMVLERAAPVCLLVWTGVGIYAFFWGLLAGRIFRVVCFVLSYTLVIHLPSRMHLREALHLVAEGSWLQVATGSSLIRDNLHVLLVGPLFGKAWVGYYAWGFQLLVASQILVQVSARISIPLFAQSETFKQRWQACIYQIRLIVVLTGPALAATLLVLPGVNETLFRGKWTPALGLLPLLFLRMLPGLTTSPIAVLVMVERGGRRYATGLVLWTIIECASASCFLYALGPTGLAWSGVIAIWPGMAILLACIREHRPSLIIETLKVLLYRPSLFIAIPSVGGLLLAHSIAGVERGTGLRTTILLGAVIVVTSYLVERDVRNLLRSVPRTLLAR